MKRYNNILEKIASWENLLSADREAQAGKTKMSRYIRRHNERRDEDLKMLQKMILDGTFKTSQYTHMVIHNDSGKDRDIYKLPYFPDRVLHHAIMRAIDPMLNNSMIYHTFACIKGKGLHFGVREAKKMLKRENTAWCVKTDFKKFYQSTPHDVVMRELRKKFKDEKFLLLMDNIIRSYDSGPEIKKMIEDEEVRKERVAHWAVHQPACGKFYDKRPGPSCKGAVEGEKLPPVLR